MGELGVYSDFPSFSHLAVRLQFKKGDLNLVSLIVGALRRLNSFVDNIDTSVAKRSGSVIVRRCFEVGIAEGLCFNYLDESEANRVSEMRVERSRVDFIVYVNYRYSKDGKPTNLLPDRYIVRFSLSHSEIRLFQMSGMRRTDPEALVSIIVQSINKEAAVSGHQGDIISIEDYSELQKN
jgi:hypothetical protein